MVSARLIMAPGSLLVHWKDSIALSGWWLHRSIHREKSIKLSISDIRTPVCVCMSMHVYT